MRTRRYVPGNMLLLLMAAAMLGGCTQEELGGGKPLPEGKYPLEFTSRMYGMEVTRATPAGTWEGDEEIAMKIGSDTKQYVADNQGNITADADVPPFYWTSTTESKDVSAYYPYTLASASVITVKEDQSNAANYQASDALYAPTTSIAFTAPEKKLTFNHLPAKVVANLKAGDGVTDAEVQEATVKFVSQSLTAPFDNATGVVTAASPGSSSVSSNELVTPAAGFDKSVQALLVPCQMKDSKFIEVTIGSDIFNYIPTTETDGNLESGKVCTYEITVKRDGIKVELTENTPWGDGGNEDVQSRSLKMQFTIDLTSYSTAMTYILPFKTSGSTGSYTLTVDWGDGSEATTVDPGTDLSTAATTSLLTHTYDDAKEYTITIITTEEDFSKEQIPGFRPGVYNKSNNNFQKLKSVNTPLLNTGETVFSSCFEACSNLISIPPGLFDNNPGITIFTNCFKSCSSLTGPIPSGLFDNNPKVTTFASCFQSCSSLTGPIPSGLFDNNPKVTSFTTCFYGCSNLSGSIPSGLFDNNPLVKTFANCFNGCSNLSGSIPLKLFDNNPSATSFLGCFHNCSSLTGPIPTGLFDNNPKVSTFNSCFKYCSELSGPIPEKLFAKNLLVKDFSNCFQLCSKLTMNANIFCDEAAEKDTRFAGKTVNFSTCFEGVGSDTSVSADAGTVPALWDNYAGTFTPTGVCFKNIGTVTNAGDIPDGWK